MIPSDETGRIALVLRNNIICILSSSLKLIRHYEPLKNRHKYVQRFHQKVEKLNYSESVPDENNLRRGNGELKSNANNLIKTLTRDYSNGLVTDLSFSSDGSHLAVSFLDSFIMLCSTSLWDVRKLIKYPDGLFARQCDFIPFMTTEKHNEINKLLLTLTSNDELMLMSFGDLNARSLDYNMNNSVDYALASNGKMLLNIQHSGEVLVYNMEECLSMKQTTFSEAKVQVEKNVKHEGYQWNVELGNIQTKVCSIFFHIFQSESVDSYSSSVDGAHQFFILSVCVILSSYTTNDNEVSIYWFAIYYSNYAIRSIIVFLSDSNNSFPFPFLWTMRNSLIFHTGNDTFTIINHTISISIRFNSI